MGTDNPAEDGGDDGDEAAGTLHKFADSDADKALRFLFADAVASVRRVLKRLSDFSDDAETVRQVDEFLDGQKDFPDGLFGALNAAQEPPRPTVLAFLLALLGHQAVHDRFPSRLERILILVRRKWPDLLDPRGARGVTGPRGLSAFGDANVALAEFDVDGPLPPALAARAGEALARLADELEHDTHFEDAIACGATASSLLSYVSPQRALAQGERNLLIARRQRRPELVMRMHAWYAHVAAKAADDGTGSWVQAFDSYEAAVRAIPPGSKTPAEVEQILTSWAKQPQLRMLRPLFAAVNPSVVPPTTDPRMGELLQSLRVVGPVVNPGSIEDWGYHVGNLATLLTDVESARLALEPLPPSAAITVSWIDRTIRHPALRRSVPNSNSLLKEEPLTLQERLLEILHETVHVACMHGGAGLSLMSMHWALLEMELRLWAAALHASRSVQMPDLRTGMQPAPLIGQPLALLGQVEQQLELEHKAQVLAQVWTPWLEGVALFIELSADPQRNTLMRSNAMTAISEMFDLTLPNDQLPDEDATRRAVIEKLAQADARVGEAQQAIGYARLRAYLGPHAPHYAAGYLAVRSVVAAWRATCGRPVDAADIGPTLIHVTQTGGYESIPDLSLPLAEFTRQAVARHGQWVATLAGASRDDLEAEIRSYRGAPDAKNSRWENGRRETISDDAVGLLEARILGWFRQSTGTLVGDAAESHDRDPRLPTEQWLGEMSRDLLMLLLGQADCPFWLSADGPRVSLLIRTREKDVTTGEPSYNLYSLPIEQADYDALAERYARLGRARLQVSRVADLYESGGMPAGSNYLVLRYDDWVHVLPMGSMMAAKMPNEEAADRLRAWAKPNGLIAAARGLFGEQHLAARRARAWLDGLDFADTDRALGGGTTAILTAWADRVKALADAIIADGEAAMPVARRDASVTLLTGVLGRDAALAADVQDHGFSALRLADRRAYEVMTDVLHRSAAVPVAADAAEAAGLDADLLAEHTGSTLGLGPFGWDVRAWATPPVAI